MKAYALLGGPTELWPEDIEEKLAQLGADIKRVASKYA